MRRDFYLLAGIVCLLLVVAPLAAQPVPNIGSASTDVIVVGKTTEITLMGDNIGDGKQIVVLVELRQFQNSLQPIRPVTFVRENQTLAIPSGNPVLV